MSKYGFDTIQDNEKVTGVSPDGKIVQSSYVDSNGNENYKSTYRDSDGKEQHTTLHPSGYLSGLNDSEYDAVNRRK